MREIVGELKKGNIFSVDPMKLKKVARQIFGKLDMSSDEIKDSQDKANKAVRDGFDEDEKERSRFCANCGCSIQSTESGYKKHIDKCYREREY